MQIAPGMHFTLSQTCLPPTTRPGGDGYTGKEGGKTLRDPPFSLPHDRDGLPKARGGRDNLKKKEGTDTQITKDLEITAWCCCI